MPPITLWAPSAPSLAAPHASRSSKQRDSKLVKKSSAVVEPLEMPDFLEVEVHATLKKLVSALLLCALCLLSFGYFHLGLVFWFWVFFL